MFEVELEDLGLHEFRCSDNEVLTVVAPSNDVRKLSLILQREKNNFEKKIIHSLPKCHTA